jgi:hypothetical protein
MFRSRTAGEEISGSCYRCQFVSSLIIFWQLIIYVLSANQVTNLREDILIYRLKYALTTMDEAQGEDYLNKATRALEK